MKSARTAFVLLGALVGCGGPPPKSPDGGALAIAPAVREPAAATGRPKAPESLAVWIHAEDPDALLDLSGLRASFSLLTALGDGDVAKWMAVVDMSKPIDVVALTTPETKKRKKHRFGSDGEETDLPAFGGAVRIRVKDVAVVLEQLSAEYDAHPENGRIRFEKKAKRHADPHAEGEEVADAPAAPEEDPLLCDFASVTSGPEWAVCGTVAGVELAGGWLRAGPRPPDAERARSGNAGAELARITTYMKPLQPFVDAAKAKADAERAAAGTTPATGAQAVASANLHGLLRDLSTVTFEIARDGDTFVVASGARFATSTNPATRAFFEKTSGVVPTDAFHRIAEDASAAVFVPGGGPLAELARFAWTTALEEATPGDRARYATRTAAVERLVDRPLEAGYGIDVPRARAALTRVRAETKDPRKAATALGRALEGYQTARLAVDVASVEALVRAWATSKNEKEKQKAQSQTLTAFESKTTYAVRAAPARLALPKGSFVLDATTVEPAPGDPKKTTKSLESTFFVPAAGAGDRSATWLVTCAEDAACAERAKQALLERPPSGATRDPLFDRPGLLAAGHLSTLVGAFALHRVSARFATVSPGSKSPFDPGTLAEIEQHLSEPKLLLPYVLVAEPRGEGGLVAFEVRGPKDAWKTIGEHVGSAPLTSSAAVLLLMYALAAASP